MKFSTILNDTSIRNKILVINSLTLAITILALSFFVIASIKSNEEVALQQENLQSQGLIQKMGYQFSAVQYWSLDLAVSWLNDSEDSLYASAEELRSLLDQFASGHPELAAVLTEKLTEYIDLNINAVDSYVDENRVQGNLLISQARVIGTDMKTSVSELLGQLQVEVQLSNERVTKANSNLTITAIVALILVLIISIGAGIGLARIITRPLNYAVAIAKRISSGNYDREIVTPGRDETGVLVAALSTMQEALKAAAEQAAENAGIRQSLDKATANIMLTDTDYNITYLNHAVKELFRQAETEIRKDIPDFKADALLGQNMDSFHKDPAHQRAAVEELRSSHVVQAKVGSLTFRLTVNPMIDETGQRLGTVVEWHDRTQQLAIEDEVQSIVQNALAGDLSARIELEGKEGFFERLSSGINQLVDVCEQIINDTIVVLSNLSQGDLTSKIDGAYQGSFDRLKHDTNLTVDKLTEVVSSIQDSSKSMAIASEQLSQGNADLNQRTAMQSASLEGTAASMEAMTSTVQQNEINATEANKLAQGAREIAEHGGTVVGKAVSAMKEISGCSNRISDIIGVINEIAFQTNLLALNASVEAARAGEQGRGFAVVASEVRNLAGRSAAAAKEIKDLIEDSTRKVDEGAKLVGDSGKTLEEIIGSVENVTDAIAEILNSSAEQATGIAQVNKAIMLMDEMTKQNSALVEEAASASEAIGEKATDLDRQMKFFKVGTVPPAPL